jgi:hypothetical protein
VSESSTSQLNATQVGEDSTGQRKQLNAAQVSSWLKERWLVAQRMVFVYVLLCYLLPEVTGQPRMAKVNTKIWCATFDRILPMARSFFHLRSLKANNIIDGDHLCDGGAERPILEWKV